MMWAIGSMGWGAVPLAGMPWHAVTLALCCVVLGVLALALRSRLASSREQVRIANSLARRRAVRMCETMRTICMIEDIAGVGVWEYDPHADAQKWSAGMRKLFGIDHDDPFVPGDAETLLRANAIDLVGTVAGHAHEKEVFTLQFDACGIDGVQRSLRGEACNMRFRDGKATNVVAVLRDVTEQIERERHLESSREAAMREAVKARLLAATDPLTGLANRRQVMARLDQMVIEARRAVAPLSLIVFDIDHFKSVNDTHGHVEGDRILVNVARIAQQQSREHDVVGRVGGEEFVWIVPNASHALAKQLAERLRTCVERHSGTDVAPAVTMSVGHAQLNPGDSALSLFARADGALYQAKNSGRNRVAMAA